MASPPLGRFTGLAPLLLLLAALLLDWTSGAAVPHADLAPCPHSCRCFKVDNLTAANCTSLSGLNGDAASDLRVLRLTGFDERFSVRAGAFAAFPHLQQLYIDRLGLTSLQPGAFRGLGALDTLSASNNALGDADEISRVLRELPNLRRLILRGNNLCRDPVLLPNWHSRSLKHLDIGRCKLSSLHVNAFAGLSHLRHVVLDGNFVRDFRATAFPRSIVSIDISNNDIERFTRSEVSRLPYLDVIEIGGNPVRCSCELHKLSNDYNMNKAVVCASPKTLFGKNLLDLKKAQVCGHTKKVKREVSDVDDADGDYIGDEEETEPETPENKGEDEEITNNHEEEKTDTLANEGENTEEEKVASGGVEEDNREEENVEADGGGEESAEVDKEATGANAEENLKEKLEPEEGGEEEKVDAEVIAREENEDVKEDNKGNEELKEHNEGNEPHGEDNEEALETVPDANSKPVDEDRDVEAVHNEHTDVSNEEEGAHFKDGGEGDRTAVEDEDVVDDAYGETVGDNISDTEGTENAEDKINEEEEDTPKEVNEDTEQGENEDVNVVDDADKSKEEKEPVKENTDDSINDKIADVIAAEREEEEASINDKIADVIAAEREEEEASINDKIADVIAAEREEEEAAERGDVKELEKFLGETDAKPSGAEDDDGDKEDETEEDINAADPVDSPNAADDVFPEESGDSKRVGTAAAEDGGVVREGHVEIGSAENEEADDMEEEPEKVESGDLEEEPKKTVETEDMEEDSENEPETEDVENKGTLPSLGHQEEASAGKEANTDDVEGNNETNDGVEGKEAGKTEDVEENENEDVSITDHLPEAIEGNEGEADTDAGDVDEETAAAKSKEKSVDDLDGTDDDVENAASVVDGDDGEEEKGAPFKAAVVPFEETEKETADRVVPEAEDRENDLFGEDEEEPKQHHPDVVDHEDDDVEAVVDDSGKIERTSDVGARTENAGAVLGEEEGDDTDDLARTPDKDDDTLVRSLDSDKTEDGLEDEELEEELKEDKERDETAEEETEIIGGVSATVDGHDVKGTEDKENDETLGEGDGNDNKYMEENEEDLGAARAIEKDDLDDYGEDEDEMKAEGAETPAENVDTAGAGEVGGESETEDAHESHSKSLAGEDFEADDDENPLAKEDVEISEVAAEDERMDSVAVGEEEDEDVESFTEGGVPDFIPGGSISEAKEHGGEGSGDEDDDGTDRVKDETDAASAELPGLDDYNDENEQPETTAVPKKPSSDVFESPIGLPTEEREEEEEASSGAGAGGEDDEVSGEEEEGSGDAHVATIPTGAPDHEESSGDFVHVPVLDEDEEEEEESVTEHEQETPIPPPMDDDDDDDNGDEDDDDVGDTEAPFIRTNVVHASAPVEPTKEEVETEVDNDVKEENTSEGQVEDKSPEESNPGSATEQPSDRGRAFAPDAPASPTGDTRMNEDLKEAESASGEPGSWWTDNVASYIVLGLIMVVIVVLLAYAVIRSRRQKRLKGKKNDADLENGGRELQDVSKPLINNHHPNGTAGGGEKQRLEDETQEPLMTKEQEASLTIEPEDKEDGLKKQNGGVVPEVVVEARPVAKTPTKTPPPTPVDGTPPVNGKATTPIDAPANGAATPFLNGGTSPAAHAAPSPPAALPTPPAPLPTPPAPQQQPVSPGAVRVVAKELPDSVAKKPIIITNRGADPAQQV